MMLFEAVHAKWTKLHLLVNAFPLVGKVSLSESEMTDEGNSTTVGRMPRRN